MGIALPASAENTDRAPPLDIPVKRVATVARALAVGVLVFSTTNTTVTTPRGGPYALGRGRRPSHPTPGLLPGPGLRGGHRAAVKMFRPVPLELRGLLQAAAARAILVAVMVALPFPVGAANLLLLLQRSDAAGAGAGAHTAGTRQGTGGM